MGLDMYLSAKKYLYSNYENPEEDVKLTNQINKIVSIKLNLGNAKMIKWDFMYWRKANHIHKWFVDNVQEGKDDCGYYHVSCEQLVTLYNLCKEVLEHKHNIKKAEQLLPTEEGFFFGGTDYDEYYFKDIEYTIEKLELLFKNKSKFDDISFEYHSSW